MNAMIYLIDVLFSFAIVLVVLRIWMQMARADFYNSVSQFVVKLTQPVLKPMRRAIPSIGSLDTSAIVLALALVMVKWYILLQVNNQTLGGGSLVLLSVVSLIKEFGVLLWWLLILRAIMSWFSQGQHPFEHIMAQLTEPFLAPIRRIIPPMGGLDLSLLILMLALNFINILLGDIVPFWRIA